MTPHFRKEELYCRCGCKLLPKQDFMDKVEALRVKLGFPFQVTSAARCPEYNAKVSSTGLTGPHTTGRAIDIGIRGKDALRLVHAALEAGFTGIGVQQKGLSRFIHIDDLQEGRPTIWSYP